MEDDDDMFESIGVGKYPCMPSLVALQQMRNRLHLALLGRKLMKWSALATGRELRKVSCNINEAYTGYSEEMKDAYMLLSRVRYYKPELNNEVLVNLQRKAEIKIEPQYKTVSAGVKVVQFDLVPDEENPAYLHLGIDKGGLAIKQAKEAWRKITLKLIWISQLRASFEALDAANRSATKRKNVLQKIVIPKTHESIKYILLELEEKAREEKFRIKKVVEYKRKRSAKKPAPVEEPPPPPVFVPPPPEPKKKEEPCRLCLPDPFICCEDEPPSPPSPLPEPPAPPESPEISSPTLPCLPCAKPLVESVPSKQPCTICGIEGTPKPPSKSPSKTPSKTPSKPKPVEIIQSPTMPTGPPSATSTPSGKGCSICSGSYASKAPSSAISSSYTSKDTTLASTPSNKSSSCAACCKKDEPKRAPPPTPQAKSKSTPPPTPPSKSKRCKVCNEPSKSSQIPIQQPPPQSFPRPEPTRFQSDTAPTSEPSNASQLPPLSSLNISTLKPGMQYVFPPCSTIKIQVSAPCLGGDKNKTDKSQTTELIFQRLDICGPCGKSDRPPNKKPDNKPPKPPSPKGSMYSQNTTTSQSGCCQKSMKPCGSSNPTCCQKPSSQYKGPTSNRTDTVCQEEQNPEPKTNSKMCILCGDTVVVKPSLLKKSSHYFHPTTNEPLNNNESSDICEPPEQIICAFCKDNINSKLKKLKSAFKTKIPQVGERTQDGSSEPMQKDYNRLFSEYKRPAISAPYENDIDFCEKCKPQKTTTSSQPQLLQYLHDATSNEQLIAKAQKSLICEFGNPCRHEVILCQRRSIVSQKKSPLPATPSEIVQEYKKFNSEYGSTVVSNGNEFYPHQKCDDLKTTSPTKPSQVCVGCNEQNQDQGSQSHDTTSSSSEGRMNLCQPCLNSKKQIIIIQENTSQQCLCCPTSSDLITGDPDRKIRKYRRPETSMPCGAAVNDQSNILTLSKQKLSNIICGPPPLELEPQVQKFFCKKCKKPKEATEKPSYVCRPKSSHHEKKEKHKDHDASKHNKILKCIYCGDNYNSNVLYDESRQESVCCSFSKLQKSQNKSDCENNFMPRRSKSAGKSYAPPSCQSVKSPSLSMSNYNIDVCPALRRYCEQILYGDPSLRDGGQERKTCPGHQAKSPHSSRSQPCRITSFIRSPCKKATQNICPKCEIVTASLKKSSGCMYCSASCSDKMTTNRNLDQQIRKICDYCKDKVIQSHSKSNAKNEDPCLYCLKASSLTQHMATDTAQCKRHGPVNSCVYSNKSAAKSDMCIPLILPVMWSPSVKSCGPYKSHALQKTSGETCVNHLKDPSSCMVKSLHSQKSSSHKASEASLNVHPAPCTVGKVPCGGEHTPCGSSCPKEDAQWRYPYLFYNVKSAHNSESQHTTRSEEPTSNTCRKCYSSKSAIQNIPTNVYDNVHSSHSQPLQKICTVGKAPCGGEHTPYYGNSCPKEDAQLRYPYLFHNVKSAHNSEHTPYYGNSCPKEDAKLRYPYLFHNVKSAHNSEHTPYYGNSCPKEDAQLRYPYLFHNAKSAHNSEHTPYYGNSCPKEDAQLRYPYFFYNVKSAHNSEHTPYYGNSCPKEDSQWRYPYLFHNVKSAHNSESQHTTRSGEPYSYAETCVSGMAISNYCQKCNSSKTPNMSANVCGNIQNSQSQQLQKTRSKEPCRETCPSRMVLSNICQKCNSLKTATQNLSASVCNTSSALISKVQEKLDVVYKRLTQICTSCGDKFKYCPRCEIARNPCQERSSHVCVCCPTSSDMITNTSVKMTRSKDQLAHRPSHGQVYNFKLCPHCRSLNKRCPSQSKSSQTNTRQHLNSDNTPETNQLKQLQDLSDDKKNNETPSQGKSSHVGVCCLIPSQLTQTAQGQPTQTSTTQESGLNPVHKTSVEELKVSSCNTASPNKVQSLSKRSCKKSCPQVESSSFVLTLSSKNSSSSNKAQSKKHHKDSDDIETIKKIIKIKRVVNPDGTVNINRKEIINSQKKIAPNQVIVSKQCRKNGKSSNDLFFASATPNIVLTHSQSPGSSGQDLNTKSEFLHRQFNVSLRSCISDILPKRLIKPQNEYNSTNQQITKESERKAVQKIQNPSSQSSCKKKSKLGVCTSNQPMAYPSEIEISCDNFEIPETIENSGIKSPFGKAFKNIRLLYEKTSPPHLCDRDDVNQLYGTSGNKNLENLKDERQHLERIVKKCIYKILDLERAKSKSCESLSLQGPNCMNKALSPMRSLSNVTMSGCDICRFCLIELSGFSSEEHTLPTELDDNCKLCQAKKAKLRTDRSYDLTCCKSPAVSNSHISINLKSLVDDKQSRKQTKPEKRSSKDKIHLFVNNDDFKTLCLEKSSVSHKHVVNTMQTVCKDSTQRPFEPLLLVKSPLKNANQKCGWVMSKCLKENVSLTQSYEQETTSHQPQTSAECKVKSLCVTENNNYVNALKYDKFSIKRLPCTKCKASDTSKVANTAGAVMSSNSLHHEEWIFNKCSENASNAPETEFNSNNKPSNDVEEYTSRWSFNLQPNDIRRVDVFDTFSRRSVKSNESSMEKSTRGKSPAVSGSASQKSVQRGFDKSLQDLDTSSPQSSGCRIYSYISRSCNSELCNLSESKLFALCEALQKTLYSNKSYIAPSDSSGIDSTIYSCINTTCDSNSLDTSKSYNLNHIENENEVIVTETKFKSNDPLLHSVCAFGSTCRAEPIGQRLEPENICPTNSSVDGAPIPLLCSEVEQAIKTAKSQIMMLLNNDKNPYFDPNDKVSEFGKVGEKEWIFTKSRSSKENNTNNMSSKTEIKDINWISSKCVENRKKVSILSPKEYSKTSSESPQKELIFKIIEKLASIIILSSKNVPDLDSKSHLQRRKELQHILSNFLKSYNNEAQAQKESCVSDDNASYPKMLGQFFSGCVPPYSNKTSTFSSFNEQKTTSPEKTRPSDENVNIDKDVCNENVPRLTGVEKTFDNQNSGFNSIKQNETDSGKNNNLQKSSESEHLNSNSLTQPITQPIDFTQEAKSPIDMIQNLLQKSPFKSYKPETSALENTKAMEISQLLTDSVENNNTKLNLKLTELATHSPSKVSQEKTIPSNGNKGKQQQPSESARNSSDVRPLESSKLASFLEDQYTLSEQKLQPTYFNQRATEIPLQSFKPITSQENSLSIKEKQQPLDFNQETFDKTHLYPYLLASASVDEPSPTSEKPQQKVSDNESPTTLKPIESSQEKTVPIEENTKPLDLEQKTSDRVSYKLFKPISTQQETTQERTPTIDITRSSLTDDGSKIPNSIDLGQINRALIPPEEKTLSSDFIFSSHTDSFDKEKTSTIDSMQSSPDDSIILEHNKLVDFIRINTDEIAESPSLIEILEKTLRVDSLLPRDMVRQHPFMRYISRSPNSSDHSHCNGPINRIPDDTEESNKIQNTNSSTSCNSCDSVSHCGNTRTSNRSSKKRRG